MVSNSSDSFFNECVREIESEYVRLEHSLGWRFLGVPKKVLRGPSRVAFISLNPGGQDEPSEHPRASQEDGSWYTTESWDGCPPGTSRLQQQVRLMFRSIANETGFSGDSDSLIGETLVANLIPFRSPSIRRLPRRPESVLFAHRLWAKVLPRVRPKLIVCLGRVTQRALGTLLRQSLGYVCQESLAYPTGWGKCTATLQTFGIADESLKLLTLPHLSRFTIFRPRYEERVKDIMKAACDHL